MNTLSPRNCGLLFCKLILSYSFQLMDVKQKANYISVIFLLICLLATAWIYLYTGTLIIAILFAPPIVHWILKRREKSD